jgi:hypothetical protein
MESEDNYIYVVVRYSEIENINLLVLQRKLKISWENCSLVEETVTVDFTEIRRLAEVLCKIYTLYSCYNGKIPFLNSRLLPQAEIIKEIKVDFVENSVVISKVAVPSQQVVCSIEEILPLVQKLDYFNYCIYDEISIFKHYK